MRDSMVDISWPSHLTALSCTFNIYFRCWFHCPQKGRLNYSVLSRMKWNKLKLNQCSLPHYCIFHQNLLSWMGTFNFPPLMDERIPTSWKGRINWFLPVRSRFQRLWFMLLMRMPTSPFDNTTRNTSAVYWTVNLSESVWSAESSKPE